MIAYTYNLAPTWYSLARKYKYDNDVKISMLPPDPARGHFRFTDERFDFELILYSQNLAPTWYSLARKYKDDPDVKISMLDCTEAKTVCERLSVTGYPTLFFFNEGTKYRSYSGLK